MIKKKLNRNNKNIPADTNVAEWINADAGTGASIESGNHICAPICADLINAHPKNKKQITSWTENITKLKFKCLEILIWVWVEREIISKE